VATHGIRDHCLAPSRSAGLSETYAGKYGRLFPGLPPLDCEEELLLRLGAGGGLCDGALGNEHDGEEAAGWPFFGQLVAHDITADRSPLELRAEADSIRNFRTPRANLECLYSAGQASPFLYDAGDPAKFLVGDGDVPRNSQGIALLGDARNDVHLLVSQLHLAFLRVHNLLVDRLREDGVAEGDLFGEARRATTWHYQWLIVEDFLRRTAGDELVDSLLESGPRFYRPEPAPFIPFEFADAAYRYGHGQIRNDYRVNDASEPAPLFPDLIGFRSVPAAQVVDWSYFFDLPDRPARQRARRIDGRLPVSLIALPLAITGAVDRDAFHSLAARDLQRGQAIGLPSGEAIAREMGVDPLDRGEVALAELGWTAETPLWYYVLREAAVIEDGNRLGPVGGRIVAEVLLGIVDGDPESYRALDPGWTPTLAERPGTFGLGALLASVTPA
jgi:hypothetical protein